jgi:hypothetical protein
MVAGIVLLALPTFGTPSGALTSHAKAPSLLSLVVGAPGGFKTESKDLVSGGRTGSINISEASSADCDPTNLGGGQWVASVLRYFDDSTAAPQTYEILCVTQLKTAHEATANRNRLLAAIGSSAIALTDIPGAYLHAVGPAEMIFFAKGVYLVRVVSTDVTPQSTALALTIGKVLAHREYVRLP